MPHEAFRDFTMAGKSTYFFKIDLPRVSWRESVGLRVSSRRMRKPPYGAEIKMKFDGICQMFVALYCPLSHFNM